MVPADQRLDADHLRRSPAAPAAGRAPRAGRWSAPPAARRRASAGGGCRCPGRARRPAGRRSEALASYIAMSARLSSAAGVGGVRRGERDAQRAADLDLHAVERDRLLQRAQQPAADPDGAVLVVGPAEQDGELVTAEPGDDARGADGGAQPRGRPRSAAASPCWWPRVSLTSLNPSRSRIMTATPGERPSATSSSAAVSCALQERRGWAGRSARRASPRAAAGRSARRSAARRWRGWPPSPAAGRRRRRRCGRPQPVGDDERAEDAGAAAQRHGDGLAGGLRRRASGAGRRPGCRGAAAAGCRRRRRARAATRPRGSAASSERLSRPVAPSRTCATSPAAEATKATSARSACSSSRASPSTLRRISSTSGELVTAWVNR